MDRIMTGVIESAVTGGDMPAAVRLAHGILEREGRPDGYLTLVTALLRAGRGTEAASYGRVLRELFPADAGIAFLLGQALHQDGRLAEAIAQWTAALDLAPAMTDACRNVAMGLIDAGRETEAADYLDRLLALCPDDATAWIQLGNIAFRQDRADEAGDYYRRALAAAPDRIEAAINLAETERWLGDADRAEGHLKDALRRDPGSFAAHFNLAGLLLEQGRWRDGFAHFEWRTNLKTIPPLLAGLPDWRPDTPAGARVALWNDQGLGDAILFLRYAGQVKARGHETVAILQKPLVRLFSTHPALDRVVAIDEPLEVRPDVQVPFASLPHRLIDADPETSWPGPLLAVPPARRDPGARTRPVGLVWAANAANRQGLRRNVPLETLAPLAGLPGLAWHSLQLGPAAADLDRSSWRGRMTDHSAGLGDLYDTAALVASLDLVITVDTVVAHVAGALGKPVWILLPRPADWKWRREGETSCWYPSARLFRQPRPGDWEGVVSLLAAALRQGPGQGR